MAEVVYLGFGPVNVGRSDVQLVELPVGPGGQVVGVVASPTPTGAGSVVGPADVREARQLLYTGSGEDGSAVVASVFQPVALAIATGVTGAAPGDVVNLGRLTVVLG